MRIGITCYATVGGSGAIASALGRLLAEEGHEVHFICQDVPFDLAGKQHPRITVHQVKVAQYPPLKYPPYAMALAVKMAAVAKLERLELLHVHYAIPHALSAYLAREMIAPQPLRIICTLHGTDITLVGADPSYQPLVRFCLGACDAVTAVSHWLTEEATRSFGLEKDVKTIYNFIDIDEYKRGGGRSGSVPVIVHISNFRPVKRTTDVIEIFKRVRDKARAKLVMVGDGPDRPRTIDLAKELGILADVDFVGVTENVIDLLSSADVFVLPSEMESFGLAALEAMACEVPVVAANTGGLAEVVEEGKSGYLLPIGDVESMAARVLEIINNTDLRSQFGKRGRKIATEKFTPRAALDAYMGLYRSLLE
jgi:N-acetyl-alpha-D-glucosaminyl L-malate synthase BshA